MLVIHKGIRTRFWTASCTAAFFFGAMRFPTFGLGWAGALRFCFVPGIVGRLSGLNPCGMVKDLL